MRREGTAGFNAWEEEGGVWVHTSSRNRAGATEAPAQTSQMQRLKGDPRQSQEEQKVLKRDDVVGSCHPYFGGEVLLFLWGRVY